MAKIVILFLSAFVFFSSCSAMMTGGIAILPKPEQYFEIMEGLNIFVQKENKELPSSLSYMGICETLKASSQVVQGILYRVAVEIVAVDKDKVFSGCIPEADCSQPASCERKFVCFTVWSRPWLVEKFIVNKKDSNDYKSCLEVNRQ